MKAYLSRDEITFSIILPVLKSAQYIEKAIDSVKNQSFKNFELILVDASTDESLHEKCKKYSEENELIKLVALDGADYSRAKNEGLKNAKNDWIIFIDSNCIMEPDMLFEISKCIYRSHADLYHFNTELLDESENTICRRIFTIENDIFRFEKELWWFKYYFYHMTLHKGGNEAFTRVFKRKTIEENNLSFKSENEVYDPDFLFIFKYTLCVKSIYVICNLLLKRIMKDGITDIKVHEGEKEILAKINKLSNYAYESTKECVMLYFKKNYYLLHFMILNYYINTILSEIPKDRLFLAIDTLNKDRKHRKFKRQALKDSKELEKYEGEIKWLKRKKS